MPMRSLPRIQTEQSAEDSLFGRRKQRTGIHGGTKQTFHKTAKHGFSPDRSFAVDEALTPGDLRQTVTSFGKQR